MVRHLNPDSISPNLRSMSADLESILCVVDLESGQEPTLNYLASAPVGSVAPRYVNVQDTSVQG